MLDSGMNSMAHLIIIRPITLLRVWSVWIQLHLRTPYGAYADDSHTVA